MFRSKKDVERHVNDVLSKINNENEKNLRGYTFARLFFQVKDYETAKKHLSGFLGIRDHHAQGHKLMAQIYEATNNPENALQSYKRSLEIDSHQSDIVLKICELYCQLSVDHETARYWADRAELLYPHNEIVFKLRECIVSAEGEPNHKELETLIATELESQPKNISLRIRLLRLYLDTERVKEAYDHATMIESKRLFPNSVEWYYLLGDVFEAFQEEFGPYNLLPDFYMQYMSALDRLILLTLAEPHVFSCENGKKHYSVNDAASVLLTFDQLLKKACDKSITESSWLYFLHHMQGQLYYNMATLLLKRSKMDQGNRKEAMRFSAGLALVCYSFKPVNLLQEIWYSQLDDNQKAFTNYFQQACLRTSFIGHMITDMCKEDKSKWLHKLKLDVCISQVKERIYSRVLSSVMEKDKLSSSFFIKDPTFEENPLEFPSEIALQEYDKAAYKLCPDSLHHLIWLELHRQAATGPKFHNNISEIFKGLQYNNKSLSKGSCESLCVLDIEAYLYASVYQTMAAMEKKKSFPSPKNVDSQLSFTPDIADPLCSKQQAAWWKAGFGLHACTIKDKLGEARRDLSHGLEVIRGIGSHGMEVQLVVYLARLFADKADYLMKEQNTSATKNKKLKPDNVSALQHRSMHYWKLALSMLEKLAAGESPRVPKEQTFIGYNKTLSNDEIKALREDGQLYIAVSLMDSEKLDEAAEMLSKLDTPYGSYYLALTLRKLASLEERYSNTKSVLLTKAKNSIHETMDRIKDDKSHPLNKEIYLVLEDIESELGTYHSINDSPNDESDEVDAFGTPELNNSVYTTPNSHKSVLHSTPRPSVQFIPTKPKATLNSTSRKHFEPSPERLDAQMRALSLTQDTIVQTLLDQQKALMQTNTTIADTMQKNTEFMKKNTEILEQLKKLLEELKITGIKGQARGSSRKTSYTKGQCDEEDYADYDPTNQLEFYTEEGSEDYSNRAAYAYNQRRLVHDAVTAPLNYVIPPAIPPGPPSLNHYNYQYPPHAVMPPPPVEQRPPYYHPPPGQGLPFSEGQQLPQFQFHVATPVVKHPPPVMTSMGAIPQPVQLPPPQAVGMQPPPPSVIPPPNVPMSIASPWAKSGTHAFQISLPQSTSFASPSSQSELKEMLKMPPPLAATASPFGQALPHVGMTPTPSIFAGISKTPETNKLERSRCDSENPDSPDVDGDLEREVMGDFKPLIPLPAEVVVETGEENEVVLFEDRAKLYRFVDQEWKERGTGIVKILHHEASGRVRLLMRRDQVLKVCANHYMSSNMEISPLKSSDRAWTWVAQDFADEVLRPEHFCIRFKTAELAASFKAAFDKAISIVKETESTKVTSPKVADSTKVTQKGFGSQFAPKSGSWSCSTCYVSNTADKLACVACDTKRIPPVSSTNSVSTSVTPATTAQSPIIPFKGTSSINQFKFSSPASTQSSGFTFGSTTISSASTTQNSFGGFTFSSSPKISEPVEPSIKEREILVISTKDKTAPEVSKISQPTSSPFSGFGFGKSPTPSGLSIQVSDTSRSVTVTGEKPTPFSELASKPFAATPTFSLADSTDGNASSLSKLQSMVQNTKPAFSFEPKSDTKTSDSSSAAQASPNTKLSADGSPEEFIPTAEFQPVVPLPALVDIKTGEEEDEKVFEERAKLFRYDPNSKEWKERGTGELKILNLKNSHKYRILMRRDQVLKICANHYILPEMKLEPKGDKSWVWFAQDYSEEELEQQQFAIRFKTVDIAKRFQTVFLDCQEKLKETKPKVTAAENECKGNSAAFEKLVSDSQTKVTEKVTVAQKDKPLSELFKTDAGSWECKVCYVRNNPGVAKCVACESPNPNSTTSQQNTAAPASIISSAAKPTGGFGGLFKPKEGTWECKSCYVLNNADTNKCVSCDSPNALGSTPKSSSVFGTTGSNTFGAFKFGSSDAPKPTFSFGTPQTNSGFVFGSKPESQPATFTFGQSTLSNKGNETTSNATSMFGGGKVFGEKTDTSFGTATKFSFGDLANSQESNEFTFGSPQKYEFSFDGVRSHSPSKAPKSPRSPAAPSDVDEDEEEDDEDGDNLYFEPVIPLPPKVEVKTGEEEEKVLYCQRAKLFRFSNSEWKERGIGDLKILLDEKTSRVRLLMRREQVLKVCLNHYLTKDIKFERRNDKSLSWTATDFSEDKASPELLAVRFKTSELADEFNKAVDDAVNTSTVTAKSPESKGVTLKPASTFSFKTDEPVTPGSGFAFGLSSRFGSQQSASTVFGNAATGFSFKDISSKPVFGGFGATTTSESKDDYIEVVYEPTIPEDKVKLTEELKLPKFFYLYENKPPCPGCIGCEDRIPPYKTAESNPPLEEKAPTPVPSATPPVTTENSNMPFSGSSFSSFSDIASNTGFQGLTPSSTPGKSVFSGAGTPLFHNLNTSAEEGGDDAVAQGPDIHFEPVIPLPDLIEVKTGEEDETPLFVFRAKLFRFDPNVKQWKERGIGDIKILSHKEKVRFRIILRRDQVHNVACNHCITEDMSLTPLSTSENALCWTAMDYSDGQGEATQFAVRFKHKEQTQQFKEVFLECQAKLKDTKEAGAQEISAVTAPVTEQEETVGASGGASGAEESGSEEESEELLFEKRSTLEVFNDAESKFKVEGMGYLKIVYDDQYFGYRVFMEGDDGRFLCEHLIAVQTCLRTEGKTAIWAAIDYAVEPVVRRQFRVTFSSMEALNEFSKLFEEGKEIAIKSPIVEKSD